MRVHLVGGFSGSGKTTAIENAIEILAERKIGTSVFRDNKNDYVVAPILTDNFGISSAKVSDGCGCCNYYDLYFQINALSKESDVSVIFAEYSGTCTNLITSLLIPLREAFSTVVELANFSTFTDAHLLLMYLKGEVLPLNVEDRYTWERHVLESEILIVNKTDLLSVNELEMLQSMTISAFSSKKILYLNSRSKDSIEDWIEIINSTDKQKLILNEKRYSGEDDKKPGFALLDEEIEFVTSDKTAINIVFGFMNNLTSEIHKKMLDIKDLHFFLSYNDKLIKLSHTDLSDKISSGSLSSEKSDSVDLMVNARVFTSPVELRDILFTVLKQFKGLEGIVINEKFISYYES